MKTIIKSTIVILLLFPGIAGCSKENSEEMINPLNIGEVTEIKLGGTSYNSKKGLSLQAYNVNDSRCPIGAICVWAGYASVDFYLTTKKRKYDFTLPTPYTFKNDTVIEGIKYELIDVLPYPELNKEQPVKTVKILVTNE